jgi:hypothetical protein
MIPSALDVRDNRIVRDWLIRSVIVAGLGAVSSPPLSLPRTTRIDPPAKPGSMAPNLSLDGAAVLLSWLEPGRPGVKPQDGDRYASAVMAVPICCSGAASSRM